MHADVEFYSVEKQAEANRLLLTKEYLELKRYEALFDNTKVYFGPDIPSTLFLPPDSHMNKQGDAAAAATAVTVKPPSTGSRPSPVPSRTARSHGDSTQDKRWNVKQKPQGLVDDMGWHTAFKEDLEGHM